MRACLASDCSALSQMPGMHACLASDCTCLAHACACFQCARVCHACFPCTTQGFCLHNSRIPRPKTIASTQNGICLQYKSRSPPQQTAFATTTKDINPRTQRHLTPQPKAVASTTQGICLQNSRTRRHLPRGARRRRALVQRRRAPTGSDQSSTDIYRGVHSKLARGECIGKLVNW